MLTTVAVAVLATIGCSTTKARVGPSPPVSWPTSGWQSASPEEQGFDSAALAGALQELRRRHVDIHSLMIVRNGRVILDAYFYPYDGTTVHELASVTKSVLTTLVGIAADQGKLSLDDPMVSFFPDRAIAHRGVLKNHVTVRQLAGMTSGLDCIAGSDDQTLTDMGAAPDWVQFTLDLKMRHIPGLHFQYSSPGMHVLSAVLQQAAGTTAAEFARAYLFEPLGITDVIWEHDPQGYSDGWAGLYLHPRDVAKIGLLMLHGGRWEGRQIVSTTWIEEATSLRAKTGMGDDYGYGWWVPTPAGFVEFAAEGRGGQYIRVIPELDMVVVTTGGGFDWNEIVPLLVPAMTDMSKALPANPAGVKALDAALATIVAPPKTQPVDPPTETACAISGKFYTFDPNPLDIKTLRLDFIEPVEARLQASFFNQPDRDLRIGLDGVYRVYPIGEHGLPMGLRGSWIDRETFQFEYDGIANREAYALRMRFSGDGVTIVAKERTHAAAAPIEGRQRDR